MERIIAVIGPTATGKTRLSIDLAKKLDTEIISGDSMLVYRGFNIGTAKPDLKEREGVIHHLIDILEPTQEFNVHLFQNLAGQLVTNINNKGSIPILAGGTGLYVKSLLEGYQFYRAGENPELRLELEAMPREKLYGLLTDKLPDTAARLHPNDTRRIIRALEIYYHNSHDDGQIFSEKKPDFLANAVVIGLNMDRGALYQRINQRVDGMIERGLVDEVANLLKMGVSSQCQAMQGIGYKEIAACLSGEFSLAVAIENIKMATRRFAKRQLTWYRKMPYIEWINISEENDYYKILELAYRLLAGKFFIRYNK